jgi:hypothetical protein
MERLIKLQRELKSPKNQTNKFGGYNYRNCEDILEAVKPLLDKHGLLLNLTDDVKELCGVMYTESIATITDIETKEIVQSKAQAGIDPAQKGMSIGQCFGASSSYARKYALNGLLLIDDNKDSDNTNKHVKTKDRTTTVVEKSAGVKKRVVAGTAEYNNLVKWIESGKGTIEKALESYDIDNATENILRKSIKSK